MMGSQTIDFYKMTEEKSISEGQSFLLDAIRGLSAQIVLVGHLVSFSSNDQRFVFQNIGVVLFFIISGHLIATSLIKSLSREQGFYNFAIDRFSRIYAPLVPAIAFCALLDAVSIFLFSSESLYFDIDDFVISNFFVSLFNFVGLPSQVVSIFYAEGKVWGALGSMRPLWTVSIEWWLYFIFSIPVFILGLQFSRWLILLLCSALFVIYAFYDGVFSYSVILVFFISSLLVLFSVYGPLYKIKIARCFAGFMFFILLAILFGRASTMDMVRFYEWYFLLLISFMVYSLYLVFRKVKVHRFVFISVRFIASYSYSLYLIHYSLICFFLLFLSVEKTSSYVFIFLACNFVSYIFYRIFESNYKGVSSFIKSRSGFVFKKGCIHES